MSPAKSLEEGRHLIAKVRDTAYKRGPVPTTQVVAFCATTTNPGQPNLSQPTQPWYSTRGYLADVWHPLMSVERTVSQTIDFQGHGRGDPQSPEYWLFELTLGAIQSGRFPPSWRNQLPNKARPFLCKRIKLMSSESHAAPGAPPTSALNGGAPADPTLKPRRARTSKPKVKTGCNNCKQRRIKCDEKRPSCANCIRSKKICSGYPPPARSARPFEEIRIAPKPIIAVATSAPAPVREPVQAIQLPPRRVQKVQRRIAGQVPPSAPPVVVLLQTPSVLPFDAQEGLYYQLFQEQTANELSGFFDSAFWARSVLQECHSEASIRHAVVALGALYKTLEKSAESPPGSPSGDRDPSDTAWSHWEMAVKQYSRACQELMLAHSADTRSNRTRLMASVLLACFDSFIGDHKQAIVQIQTGLGLLEQLRAERRRAFLPRPEEPVEAELIQMFTRMAIQAKSYDMAFHFPQPYVVRLTQPSADPTSPGSDSGGSPVSIYQDPIPDRFSSVLEARFKWDALAERIFRFTETMFNQSQSGVMGILPTSVRQFGLRFKQEMEAWSDAFEHILVSRTAPGVSSQEKACIAVLKMYQIMSYILFLMTFSDSEMGFDKYTDDFNVIVDLALEVVGDEERRAAMKRCPDPRFCHHRGRHDSDASFGGLDYSARHIKPSFSADLGIVPPLFVVATKCRDRPTRWKAIQLLKSSPRREGMWDSELTARIAMWIADIEDGPEPEVNLDDLQNSFRSPTPGDSAIGSSPGQAQSPRPSTSGSSVRVGSIDFSDAALGPGGNARWDMRRESRGESPFSTTSQRTQRKSIIPEDRRVMVRAVEFDLRERFAVVQLGSRDLPTGTPDLKTRVTKITW
ncbi:hypothetical protein QBC47DRAFT_461823 [Echria macrotheca]|uniref:Zn(2)-C6 fungal-type domain-containing protein n=1 Tax=Echria macrotheca TaxID=438768 RepID=A0AAJ0FB43_9PEZI|nr:hypothetical protein QBC47DRAFT_461823 [Echria macrotheca]